MQEITDGSATFRVINKKLQTIFDLLYPLSSIYISGADNGIPPGKNEGLATWEELPADKVLQTASGGAGGMIEAGLPNITGKTWLRPISTGDGIVWDNQSVALHSMGQSIRLDQFPLTRQNQITFTANQILYNRRHTRFARGSA